jgi:hypothetical protein
MHVVQSRQSGAPRVGAGGSCDSVQPPPSGGAGSPELGGVPELGSSLELAAAPVLGGSLGGASAAWICETIWSLNFVNLQKKPPPHY